jgi:AbrB family looped-hinge helix DNA binding protein
LYERAIDMESVMDAVTISPKFQVVIPKAIRESLGLRPGQKVQAVQYGERIELVPMVPVSEMRGFLSGMDTDLTREADRL